jgi:hypothetical protein
MLGGKCRSHLQMTDTMVPVKMKEAGVWQVSISKGKSKASMQWGIESTQILRFAPSEVWLSNRIRSKSSSIPKQNINTWTASIPLIKRIYLTSPKCPTGKPLPFQPPFPKVGAKLNYVQNSRSYECKSSTVLGSASAAKILAVPPHIVKYGHTPCGVKYLYKIQSQNSLGMPASLPVMLSKASDKKVLAI